MRAVPRKQCSDFCHNCNLKDLFWWDCRLLDQFPYSIASYLIDRIELYLVFVYLGLSPLVFPSLIVK